MSKGREAREGSGEAGEGSEYETTEERVSEADTNEEVWTQESMKSWLKKWEEKQKEEWEARMSDLEGLMRTELKRVLSTDLRYVLRKELVAETGTRNTEGREPGGEGWRCEDCERRRERRTEESGPRQGNFRQTWWKDWGESNHERVEQVGKEKDRAEFETRKKDNEEQKKTRKRSNEERIQEGRQETTQSPEINTSGRKSTDSGTEGWGEGKGPQETQEKMEEPPRWREKTGTRRESSSGSESEELERWFQKTLRVEVKVEGLERRQKGGWLIRAEDLDQKIMVMKEKTRLGEMGWGVYIEDDLTERQRVVQAWREKEARNWRRRGIQVETAYNSLMVDGAGLEWDEEKGELRQKGSTETHLEAKGMKRMREKLNSKFEWFGKEAKRIHKRGKASGGHLVGIRKTLKADWIVEEWEYGMKLRIQERESRESYRVITIYNNVRKNLKRALGKMDELVEDSEGSEERLIIVGDLNARSGELQGVADCGWKEEIRITERKSQDKTIRGEGKKLMEWCEERALLVQNGRARGDEEGKITFAGEGAGLGSVLDYVLVKMEGNEAPS
ncbi:uncharacterized protein LOC107048360 [Diachasma alloeum]|uniref:uncharacterized protein LOC107048360 n=1 Tax=Diachasma alloeum TaxID=454923 RepID=UPI0007383D42|nr:uncharacterized protein LOC107048360 [Diachasma alloeum]